MEENKKDTKNDWWEKTYCGNCGKKGHVYKRCNEPIFSLGIILFKIDNDNDIKFLLIRRKHSLGFVEFMRGRYSFSDIDFLKSLCNEMTFKEKEMIINNTFEDLWVFLWSKKNKKKKYRNDFTISKTSAHRPINQY